MNRCSYCAAEYADDVVMCAIDHTSLEPPVISSSRKFVMGWPEILSVVRLFSFFLAGIGFCLTNLMLGARIDAPSEFVGVLWQDRFNAIPIPFAVFLLILTLPRPRAWMRAALAVVAGFVLWFFAWRWLIHCDYAAWQGHGLQVIEADYNHVVYATDGITNQWVCQTMGFETSPRGIPMLLASTFVFAAIAAGVVQVISIWPKRASCRNSEST